MEHLSVQLDTVIESLRTVILLVSIIIGWGLGTAVFNKTK
jgi:hypothetical protein